MLLVGFRYETSGHQEPLESCGVHDVASRRRMLEKDFELC